MCVARVPWYAEPDGTVRDTSGSLDYLFDPCMTLLSHPSAKIFLENSQVALKTISFTRALER